MRTKNKSFAVILIGLGILMLCSSLGIHIGGIMSFLMPILLIALGYYGIKRGSMFGWVFFILGILLLLGKLTWIFGLLIALGVIAYGVSMLKGQVSH